MKRCAISWSGGKDSCYAALKAIEQGYKPVVLLNVLNEEGKISRSHGIPSNILEAQAKAANLPMQLIASSWQEYQQQFIAALHHLKQTFAISHVVFGDIDLDDHKAWEDMVCREAGLRAVLPLWKGDRRALVQAMIDTGLKTTIVSCNEQMGEHFLGRELSTDLITQLESMAIDPCGENGEFHTLVTDAPFFSAPIKIEVTRKLVHEGYWFSDLNLIL